MINAFWYYNLCAATSLFPSQEENLFLCALKCPNLIASILIKEDQFSKKNHWKKYISLKFNLFMPCLMAL
jgi:hypothetical protein